MNHNECKTQNEQLLKEIDRLREQLQAAERAEEEAETLLAFYQEAANAMPNPIFIKDDALRFVFFNRAYREFFGLTDDSYIGKQVQDLEYLSPEDRERYHNEDSEMLQNQSVIKYEMIFKNAQDEAVETLYWSKGFSSTEGEHRGLVGEIVDISREKRLQRDLSRSMQVLQLLMKDAKDASRVDPLTKLYNRSVMTEEIPHAVKETAAEGHAVCAIMIDLDHFKEVNDRFGHLAGDDILSRFGAILKDNFRQSDVLIRYGGDEFMAVLPGAALAQAKEVAERLCNRVRASLLLPDGNPMTVSVGVSQYRVDESLMNFISRVDEALYLAKKSGRDRVEAVE